MVTVVIPWRPQPSRIASYEVVTAWYRENLPEARIVAVDSGDEPFNLARCRNVGLSLDGVAGADGVDGIDGPGSVDEDEVFVISDADTFPQPGPLREAIAAARDSGLVHLPYTAYHWLGATGTAQLLAGTPPERCDFELVRGACSGVYVTSRRTWASHGGQDETFRGWGFEDAAWYVAHTTLLGAPPQRHEGSVFALHHVTQLREGPQYDANAARMQSYRDAAASADPLPAMRALVGLAAD